MRCFCGAQVDVDKDTFFDQITRALISIATTKRSLFLDEGYIELKGSSMGSAKIVEKCTNLAGLGVNLPVDWTAAIWIVHG